MPDIKCPACGSEVSKLWESVGGINGGSWFTGLYSCPKCWQFKASGTEREGIRRVVQWHPCCPYHGADPVILTLSESQDLCVRDMEWTCTACGRKMAVVDKQIQTIWKPYAAMFLDMAPASEAALRDNSAGLELGGLPHD